MCKIALPVDFGKSWEKLERLYLNENQLSGRVCMVYGVWRH
jgi:hypothetical protein